MLLAQAEDRATQRCDPSAALGRNTEVGGRNSRSGRLFRFSTHIGLRRNALNLRGRMLRLLLHGCSPVGPAMALSLGKRRGISRCDVSCGNPVFHSSIRALSPSWDSKGARLPHLATSSEPSGTSSSPHNRKLDCTVNRRHGGSPHLRGRWYLRRHLHLPVQLADPAVGHRCGRHTRGLAR